jgi:hypothetical protein
MAQNMPATGSHPACGWSFRSYKALYAYEGFTARTRRSQRRRAKVADAARPNAILATTQTLQFPEPLQLLACDVCLDPEHGHPRIGMCRA